MKIRMERCLQTFQLFREQNLNLLKDKGKAVFPWSPPLKCGGAVSVFQVMKSKIFNFIHVNGVAAGFGFSYIYTDFVYMLIWYPPLRCDSDWFCHLYASYIFIFVSSSAQSRNYMNLISKCCLLFYTSIWGSHISIPTFIKSFSCFL